MTGINGQQIRERAECSPGNRWGRSRRSAAWIAVDGFGGSGSGPGPGSTHLRLDGGGLGGSGGGPARGPREPGSGRRGPGEPGSGPSGLESAAWRAFSSGGSGRTLARGARGSAAGRASGLGGSGAMPGPTTTTSRPSTRAAMAASTRRSRRRKKSRRSCCRSLKMLTQKEISKDQAK